MNFAIWIPLFLLIGAIALASITAFGNFFDLKEWFVKLPRWAKGLFVLVLLMLVIISAGYPIANQYHFWGLNPVLFSTNFDNGLLGWHFGNPMQEGSWQKEQTEGVVSTGKLGEIYLDQQLGVADYKLEVTFAVRSENAGHPNIYFLVRSSNNTPGYIITLIHDTQTDEYEATLGVEVAGSTPHEQLITRLPQWYHNILPYGKYGFTTAEVTVKGNHITFQVGETLMINFYDERPNKINTGDQIDFGCTSDVIVSVINVTVETA